MEPHWELVRAAPAPDLAGAVVGYSGYREMRPLALDRREVATTIIPLIINFGAPFVMTMPNGECFAPESFAAGVIDRPVLVSSRGASACVQIDFSLAGAYRFFHLDPREMAGRVIALDDLGLEGSLTDRLGNASSWRERFCLLDGLVRGRLARGRGLSAEVDGALRLLQGGRRRIRDIAATIGWSERHLARRFAIETGVAPKTVARIRRFEAARQLAAREEIGGWAEFALATGYADQAHLIREFRLLSGLTPAALKAQDADMAAAT
jgi:AraC-like DNA-binding protein